MKKDWWNKEFSILITLGESTTAGGWASSRERSWPYLLTNLINELQRIPVQLINQGIGANVISTKSPGYDVSGKPAANERLEEHVLSHTANGALLLPDLLVISYGLNDTRVGTSVELFCDEMEDIVRRVRNKIEPLIVLVGPYYMYDFVLSGPRWSYANIETFYKFNEATRVLAEKIDCLFVDLLASYGDADWLVHYDGCHANDVGHRIVANKIFEVLASNCSGLAMETKYLEKCIIPWRDESTLQTNWELDHT